MKHGSKTPVKGNGQPAPEKPYEGFPLFPHRGSGQWAKKIRGKLHDFGSWREDREGKKGLERFNREWPFLSEGRTPPPEARELIQKFGAKGGTIAEDWGDLPAPIHGPPPSAKPKQKPEKDLLTPAEVARRLGVRVARVRQWCESKELKAVDASEEGSKRRRWRITREAIAEFLESRTTQPPAPKPKSRRRRTTKPTRKWV